MMKFKKSVGLMLAFLLMVSVFAACGQKPASNATDATTTQASGTNAPTTTGAPKPVTLKLLGHTGSFEDSQAVKSAVEKFKTDYPHITLDITSIGTNEYNNKRAILIAGGEVVDAMAVSSPLDTINLAQSKMIIPMDEYAANATIKPEDVLKADILNMEKNFDGKIYKLPYTTTTWLLFYNKDLFDAAGIEYPSTDKAMTWSQYMDLAKRLTKGEGADKIYGAFQLVWPQYWYTMATSALGGGEAFYTSDGKSNITEPKFSEALKANYDMQFADKSLVTYFDVKLQKLAVPSFATGKYAMFYTGSFAINGIAKQNIKFKMGIAPMPIPDGMDPNYKYTFGGSTGFALTRTTKNHNEAYLFAAEMVKNYAEVADNIPSFRSDETTDKMCKTFADKYPGHDLTPELWKKIVFGDMKFITEKITGPASVEYEAIVNEEVEKYYTNAQSLEATIKAIETRANEAIANAKTE